MVAIFLNKKNHIYFYDEYKNRKHETISVKYFVFNFSQLQSWSVGVTSVVQDEIILNVK